MLPLFPARISSNKWYLNSWGHAHQPWCVMVTRGRREQAQAERWYHFPMCWGMLLQDSVHNLGGSPAEGSCAGTSPGWVDFSTSAVVTEDTVLRLHSSMENREEGGRKNILCISQLFSISQAKICSCAQGALNILGCTCRDDWALHIWRAEALPGELVVVWESRLLKLKVCICRAVTA